MVVMVNYDVYLKNGKEWEFLERFDEDKKQDAYNLAYKYQNTQIPVKIVYEVFDIEKNTYSEKLEFLSGFTNKQKKIQNKKTKKSSFGNRKVAARSNKNNKDFIKDGIVKALFKMVFIVVLALIMTHLLVKLVYPIIESYLDFQDVKTVMFFIYFVVFLFISIPLLIKKVPWDVFLLEETPEKKVIKVDTEEYYKRAEYISNIYNISVGEDIPVAPVAKNVGIEYKNEVISFLDIVIKSIDKISIKDSFTKLGIKFVLFGGIMELSKYRGLSFPVANALLYETFTVIDGEENTSLEKFYESKDAYRDIDLAVFMTGIGAKWMNSILNKGTFHISIFNKALKKWKKQKEITNILLMPIISNEELFKTFVGIKHFIDCENLNDNDIKIIKIRDRIANIANKMYRKYGGTLVKDEDNKIGVLFPKVSNAIKFSIDFINNIEQYQKQIEEEFICGESCVIFSYDDVLLKNFEKLFTYSRAREILVDKDIYSRVSKEYRFSHLGTKEVIEELKVVDLYELHF